MPYGGVHQGVGGPGVEGQWLGAGSDDGDVGDAAQVEGGGDAGQRGQGEDIGHGDQRRPLTADRDVPAAQVGDDGQTGRLGDPGGLAELEGAAHGAVLDPVVHGLPVRDHQVRGAPAQLAHRPHGHVGERLLPTPVSSRATVRIVADDGGRSARDQIAQLVRVGGGEMPRRAHHQSLAPQFEVCGGRLDGVVGRA
ncbi:hypothetical protein STENM223S_02115 [Streptomyces tendae]